MYKRIGTFNFSTYSFIPELDSKFNSYVDILLEEFTYSIFKKYVLADDYLQRFTNQEIEVLKSVITEANYFDLHMESETALILLSQIFQMEMENFLKVPIKELDEKRHYTPKLSFDKYMLGAHKKVLNEQTQYELCRGKVSTLNIIEYPKYFRLYRARNIVISKFNKRKYSNKTLLKTIQSISEEYKQDLYLKIIKDNYKILNDENIGNILFKLIEASIKHFINSKRLGMTMEEGDVVLEELNLQLKEHNTVQNIFNKLESKFKKNFNKFINPDFYNDFSEELISVLEQEVNKIGVSPEKFMTERFSDYKMFILSEIFRSSSNVEELIESAYQNYTKEMKWKIAEKVIEDNLSLNDFEIAIRVSDLSISENLYHKQLTSDIEVLSHAVFKNWQYQKYDDMHFSKRRLLETPDNEKTDSLWFILKNIRCGRKDTDLAYLLAKEKLSNYLELVYYFVSKEDEYNFKILDPYILINNTSNNGLLGRKNSPYNKAKNVDDFTDDLLKFLKDLLNSQKSISFDINNCIKLYFKMGNETEINNKSRLLIKIWETIFKTQDIHKLSLYCSIIIAGTNYNSNDITYKDMRKILYEDFLEFIYISNEELNSLVIEETFERFKVFTKNIIGTYLFNIPLNDSINYDMRDILEWILYINPNDEFISRGVMDNE